MNKNGGKAFPPSPSKGFPSTLHYTTAGTAPSKAALATHYRLIARHRGRSVVSRKFFGAQKLLRSAENSSARRKFVGPQRILRRAEHSSLSRLAENSSARRNFFGAQKLLRTAEIRQIRFIIAVETSYNNVRLTSIGHALKSIACLMIQVTVLLSQCLVSK